MPDITLLIPFANFFEVTTDHLLGVDLSRNTQRINAILCRATEITANRPSPTGHGQLPCFAMACGFIPAAEN